MPAGRQRDAEQQHCPEAGVRGALGAGHCCPAASA